MKKYSHKLNQTVKVKGDVSEIVAWQKRNLEAWTKFFNKELKPVGLDFLEDVDKPKPGTVDSLIKEKK